MLLAVNANSLFKEPCKGCTKSVCIFGTGKPRVAWVIKLHVEIDRSYPLMYKKCIWWNHESTSHSVCWQWKVVVQLPSVKRGLSCRLRNTWDAPNTRRRKIPEERIACCIQATHGSYKSQEVHLCFQLTQTFPWCILFHVCMQLWSEIHSEILRFLHFFSIPCLT